MPNGTAPLRFGEDVSTVRDRWHREHRTISTDVAGDGDWLGDGMLPVPDLRDVLMFTGAAWREAFVWNWRNEGWFIAAPVGFWLFRFRGKKVEAQ
jgi:hypothetical protein